MWSCDRDIRKKVVIRKSMSRYSEVCQLPIEKSEISKARLPKYLGFQKRYTKLPKCLNSPFRDIRILNILHTEIFEISITFYQDLWNASTANVELSGISSATFWDIRKIISSLSRYLENNQLLTEISGRSSATNWDIRKIISYLLRYPEYQHPAYWDNWNINSATVLPKCIECLNSPFRGIWKIISYLLRYLDYQHPAYCDIWDVNRVLPRSLECCLF